MRKREESLTSGLNLIQLCLDYLKACMQLREMLIISRLCDIALILLLLFLFTIFDLKALFL